MSTPHSQTRSSLPRLSALARALIGWLVLNAGLGAAVGITDVLHRRIDLDGPPRYLVQAALMSAIVVPVIVFLRWRLDRRSLAEIGVHRRSGRPLLIGLSVGLATAALVWVPAGLAGWIRVDAIDLSAFVIFLVLNGLALLFFEALPEELAYRGYVWTNLRDGWGLIVATVVTTALFPLGAPVSSLVRTGIAVVSGSSVAWSYGFPGGDALTYIVQLILFGLALIAARRIPIEGALFIAVAFHWTQLTVNRVLLNGLGWVDSGWAVTLVQPDAIFLVAVHIIVAGVTFVVIRRLLGHVDRRGAAAPPTPPPADSSPRPQPTGVNARPGE